MEKIKLIADSTIDITDELIKELDCLVVPLTLSFEDEPEKVYHDGVDIKAEDIIEHVKRTGKLPQTSAVGPGVYEEIFNAVLNEGYSIIFTGIGAKLSSNMQSVIIGREMSIDPSRITIIDSATLSSASGLLLLRIRDLINEGKTREEIKEICDNEITPYTSASFCIATTDYMVKGGRCSAFVGFMAKLFGIKPILKVNSGKLDLDRKVIGSINQALYNIYQELMKNIERIDQKYLMITHFASDAAEQYIKKIIEDTCHFENIYCTHAGCIISSHCGPGTIGLLYNMKKEEKN